LKLKVSQLWGLPSLMALALLIAYYSTIRRWIAVHTGSINYPGSPPNYPFWSGFGSDLGQYTLITTFAGHFVLLWRTNTCHGRWWCWRHPHFELAGTPYKLCYWHHPDEHHTVREAIRLYARAKETAKEAA
jgi:hypothetical protein